MRSRSGLTWSGRSRRKETKVKAGQTITLGGPSGPDREVVINGVRAYVGEGSAGKKGDGSGGGKHHGGGKGHAGG
ncbi:hypothetical protein [Methanosphaerula subterraneus]|uniref:hypothetical protein n=1 Tax=Methanosphaerula subterraneus TaxID=3350244 RepID=UPI003F846E80